MIDTVYDQIEPYQATLKAHPLYQSIQSVDHLIIFMSFHIYSVWDFMNLLKTLQTTFTCTSIPWRPTESAANARFINEIVLEEESDFIDGQPTSHFMYYVEAIKALNETSPIDQFTRDLTQNNYAYHDLIQRPYIPKSVQNFLKFSYQTIQSSVLETAAAFAFGRETLVPILFEPLLSLKHLDPKVNAFISYLERHIELDGDQHGALAEKMVENLCHTEQDWAMVTQTAKAALQARINFWDAIVSEINV